MIVTRHNLHFYYEIGDTAWEGAMTDFYQVYQVLIGIIYMGQYLDSNWRQEVDNKCIFSDRSMWEPEQLRMSSLSNQRTEGVLINWLAEVVDPMICRLRATTTIVRKYQPSKTFTKSNGIYLTTVIIIIAIVSSYNSQENSFRSLLVHYRKISLFLWTVMLS